MTWICLSCMLWPEDLEAPKTHHFKVKTFKKVKPCGICRQVITREGCTCKVCSFSCHPKCRAKFWRLEVQNQDVGEPRSSERCRGDPSLPLPSAWGFASNLWRFLSYRGISPVLRLHMVFSLYVFASSSLCVCLTLCPNFYKDTSHARLRPTTRTSL
uniref:tensin-1 isoform X2 n=1 Tax=Halichoerus grypus TaxID=9711 RepID=UPI00165981EE|nr:tensin-1 isoform X2 [Halichoerus grypus]